MSKIKNFFKKKNASINLDLEILITRFMRWEITWKNNN